jgi:hypothetical protein
MAVQLLYFSSGHDQDNKRLEAAVHKVIPKQLVEQFEYLDDFEARLRRPVEPDSIAVLSVSSREELRRIQTLRRLLTEIFVVMVIPDRKKGTIRLAHLLLPRFLSQNTDNFTDLSEVLNKMYRTLH